MIYKGVEICCPACKGDFEYNPNLQDAFSCKSCGKVFPLIAGIPDLRVYPDPYLDFEPDREKALKLEEQSKKLDFIGLLDFYYNTTDVVPVNHAAIYKRGLVSGVAKSEASLSAWSSRVDLSFLSEGWVLEIGCGTGPLLIAMSRKTRHLIGIDIALRWLVVAKKRLSEAGLDIPILCACAEALPFPSDFFSGVAAESSLEHLRDQILGLSECRRVMLPAGNLLITTPNRYSIGPDPNVGVIAGGYLPEKALATIVHRQGGIPPKRHLLSDRQLKILLKEAGFGQIQIFLADFPESQRRFYSNKVRLLMGAYMRAKQIPLLNRVLHLIGPLYYAVASKPVM